MHVQARAVQDAVALAVAATETPDENYPPLILTLMREQSTEDLLRATIALARIVAVNLTPDHISDIGLRAAAQHERQVVII